MCWWCWRWGWLGSIGPNNGGNNRLAFKIKEGPYKYTNQCHPVHLAQLAMAWWKIHQQLCVFVAFSVASHKRQISKWVNSHCRFFVAICPAPYCFSLYCIHKKGVNKIAWPRATRNSYQAGYLSESTLFLLFRLSKSPSEETAHTNLYWRYPWPTRRLLWRRVKVAHNGPISDDDDHNQGSASFFIVFNWTWPRGVSRHWLDGRPMSS